MRAVFFFGRRFSPAFFLRRPVYGPDGKRPNKQILPGFFEILPADERKKAIFRPASSGGFLQTHFSTDSTGFSPEGGSGKGGFSTLSAALSTGCPPHGVFRRLPAIFIHNDPVERGERRPPLSGTRCCGAGLRRALPPPDGGRHFDRKNRAFFPESDKITENSSVFPANVLYYKKQNILGEVTAGLFPFGKV